jgi:hypothetical protein
MPAEPHNSLRTVKDAKEFLASQIAEEAQREGVSLSEIERKMLFFTESGWTLPDIADVYDEFERDYDQNSYEEKITKLIRGATHRVRKENPDEYKKWIAAVQKLSKGDHYIQIMTGRAGLKYGRPVVSWKFTLGIIAVIALYLAVRSLMDFDLHMIGPGTGMHFNGSGQFVDYPKFDRIFGTAAGIAAAFAVLWGWVWLIDRNHVVANAAERCYQTAIEMLRPRNSRNINS